MNNDYIVLYNDGLFEVGHWIGTQDFQYIKIGDWSDIFQYTPEGLECLDHYRKTKSNMTDQQFDKLCNIIAACENDYKKNKYKNI